MQVTVAKTAGFCFGVRRALELTQKSAALSPTCTLGELIHNRQVVEELAGQGVTVIERPEDAPAGTAVVIRSHGVGPQVYDTLRAQGSPVIDATCPFVKRIHQIAAEVPENGLLLLAGRREHPEVQGILGYCRGAGSGLLFGGGNAGTAGIPAIGWQYPRHFGGSDHIFFARMGENIIFRKKSVYKSKSI